MGAIEALANALKSFTGINIYYININHIKIFII
jgi:hypothetical protein